MYLAQAAQTLVHLVRTKHVGVDKIHASWRQGVFGLTWSNLLSVIDALSR